MIHKFIPVIVLLATISCQPGQSTIDYFGQTPPEKTPIIFALGFICLDTRFEACGAFSPDGKSFYFSVTNEDFTFQKIFFCEYLNNKWTTPDTATFFKNFNNHEPFILFDGQKLFFISDRDKESLANTRDIFYVTKLIKMKNMQQIRQDFELPPCTEDWGWKYHHLGIPTDMKMPNERYLSQFKMYVSGFSTSPFGVEWMRFEEDSPISKLTQTVPHIAFEVENIDKELEEHDFEILSEPGVPSQGVRAAMIKHNGAPIELIEFKNNYKIRKEHELPLCIEDWGWKYHHLGIPTDKVMPNEECLPNYKLYFSGFSTSPFGIEWMRFEEDCPISDIIKSVPHIAFEVDNIDKELEEHNFEILTKPNIPSDGIRVAMILHNGASVELIEF